MQPFSTLLVLAFACAPASSSPAGAQPAADSQPPAAPVQLPKRPPVVQFSWDLRGTVVALSDKSFTVVTDKREKHVFGIGPIMIGGRPAGHPDSHSYRLDQIRVGDDVIVQYFHYDGDELAIQTLIRRRPGGTVPEQPGTSRTAGARAWHRRMNAYQAWEEHGIPLPPEYAARPPADLNPPYRPGAPRATPTAPPPREVVPVPIGR